MAQEFAREDRSFGVAFVTVGAILASIAFVMELTLIPLLLNAIRNDLGLSVSDMTWVFNSYAVAVASAVLVSGIAGDLVDRRRLFVVGVFLFGAGSLWCAASGDLLSLSWARVLQGLGGGLFSPLVPVLLTQTNKERSGRILMLWSGTMGMSAAALPVMGTLLLWTIGWRSVFCLIAAVAAVGLALAVIGKTKSERGVRVAIANYGAVLKKRTYLAVLAYIFMTYGSFSLFLFYSPLSWDRIGFQETEISVFLTCVWVSFAVFSFLLRDRVGGRGLYACLSAAPVCIALGFAISVALPGVFVAQIGAAGLLGAGLSLCLSPSTQLLLKIAPENLHAFSSSLDITFARLGGIALVAALATAEAQPVAVMVVLLMIASLLMTAVFRRH